MLAFTASALLGLAAAAGAAPTVAVYVDHPARLQITGQAASVIVGDATIADVIVVDHHTVYVQGKSFGQTGVVVLDPAGQPVWQGEVAVVAQDQGRVSVIRGAGSALNGAPPPKAGALITEMTCATLCTPATPPPEGKSK
jgi:Flp pilus assembly secretin CpaC